MHLTRGNQCFLLGLKWLFRYRTTSTKWFRASYRFCSATLLLLHYHLNLFFLQKLVRQPLPLALPCTWLWFHWFVAFWSRPPQPRSSSLSLIITAVAKIILFAILSLLNIQDEKLFIVLLYFLSPFLFYERFIFYSVVRFGCGATLSCLVPLIVKNLTCLAIGFSLKDSFSFLCL